jgi:hypothetical protein
MLAEKAPREVKFYQLNWAEAPDYCKARGVRALPFVKMFTVDGEVESFPCGPKKVARGTTTDQHWL